MALKKLSIDYSDKGTITGVHIRIENKLGDHSASKFLIDGKEPMLRTCSCSSQVRQTCQHMRMLERIETMLLGNFGSVFQHI